MTVAETQHATTCAIMTKLIDRMYADLVKSQGDHKSLLAQHRAARQEVTHHAGLVIALRKQLDELSTQYDTLLEHCEEEIWEARKPLIAGDSAPPPPTPCWTPSTGSPALFEVQPSTAPYTLPSVE